jgi:hypothetical protein
LQILREIKSVPDDLKNYKQDAFALLDSETAGAILGVVVAALFLFDLAMRVIEKVFG